MISMLLVRLHASPHTAWNGYILPQGDSFVQVGCVFAGVWGLCCPCPLQELLHAASTNCLLLKSEHAGYRIKVEYTPVSTGGIPGMPITAMSDAVTQQEGPMPAGRANGTAVPESQSSTALQLPPQSYCMKVQSVKLPEDVGMRGLPCNRRL